MARLGLNAKRKERFVKAMWIAFICTAIIAIGADYSLDFAGYSIAEKTKSSAVRLDN